MKLIPGTKVVFSVLFSVVGLYVLVLVLFYLFHNRLIFQRTTLDKDHTFTFDQPFEEHFIEHDDITINALLFRSPTPSKGLIFYLHGNADDLQRWGNFAADFTSKGYDVFMFDYRGYGKSTGLPSREELHKDASFIFQWVIENISTHHLIIYGRSLGSALASKLAAAEQPDLLVLETPFADFKDVFYWPLMPVLYLLGDDIGFSNIMYMQKVKCRKVIIHGTDDWVVSLSSAEKLKPFLNEKDRFVTIEGGGHRNLNMFPLFHETLKQVLE